MAHDRKSHHGRDDLTGEHAFGDTGQMILLGLFAVVWVADTFFLRRTTFLNQYVPLFARIIAGGVLIVLSGWLAKTTMGIVFGEVRDVPGVIRAGVYNVVRHPMYLSEIILYLACLIMSMSLAAVTVWVVAITFLVAISRYEEKLLIKRFGDDYRAYIRDVPMMIPRFW